MASALELKVKWWKSKDESKSPIAEFKTLLEQERKSRGDEDHKRVLEELKRQEHFKQSGEFNWQIPATFTYLDIEEFVITILEDPTWNMILSCRQPKDNWAEIDFASPPFCGPGPRGPKDPTILSL